MPKSLAFFLLSLVICSSCARKNFFQESALTIPAEKTAIASGNTPDSVTVTVGRHYDKGFFQTFLFGKHYRKLWATPVKLPVYDMGEAKGGLTPVSMGGGFQTTSLTLKDKAGRQFVLRSLDKDPEKTLPPGLRHTFLLNVIRDQTSAANPFAPLVLPHLSRAAGIYYTSPDFYYVAENDSTMGKHAPRVNGKVMMLEEKFEGKKNLIPMFGNAVDLVDSEDLLEERYADSRHRIDQQFFARNRLFDVLIGDWDRHEGQWQWAVYKNGNNFIYKPIAKDRDQTFYRFNDGVITWLASKLPFLKKFQTFHHHYGNMSGWLFNAEFIDARALNEVTRQEWQQQAQSMKAAITDTVIENAIARFPQPIYEKNGEQTIRRLKSRRDKLPEAAEAIYEILAKKVTVAGTDQKEKFMVERLPSGDTRVRVYSLENKSETPFYERLFIRKETKEITLHGLRGDDEFEISGEAPKAIKLKVFGGPGEDELTDTSNVKGWCKKTHVYDTRRGIEVVGGPETKKKLTWDVAVHAYDYEGI